MRKRISLRVASPQPLNISSPEGKIMDFESNDSVGGYAVPVDPMDLLQCDSCQ